MDKISVAEYLSTSETNQLASSIIIKEKREFILTFFPFLIYFDFIYRRKPSSKAKYMLEAANVDAASKSDDWTPPARYCLYFFVFH